MPRPLTPEELTALGLDAGQTPKARPLTQDELQRLGIAAPPIVGAGETFVNRAVGTIPLGGTLTDLGSSAVLRAVDAVRGRQGIELTPEAQRDAEAAGIAPPAAPAPEGFLETYRRQRERRQERTAAGAEQNPWASRAGTGAGLLLSLAAPLPAANLGTSTAARIGSGLLTGTGYGGLQGLEEGAGDLSRGDFGAALKKAGKGATVGAGVGLVGGTAGAALQRLVGKAKGKISEAVADETEKRAQERLKDIRSAMGTLGGEKASVLKTYERLTETVADPQSSQALRDAAQKELADPRFRQALESARLSYAQSAQEQLGRLNAAEAALAEARAQDVGEMVAQGLANPFRTQVLPRLQTYASRAIPIALGSAVGGMPGMVLGGMTAAALGRPGTALANMLKSPSFRRMAWTGVQNAAETLSSPATRALGERYAPGRLAEALAAPTLTPEEERLALQRARARALISAQQ